MKANDISLESHDAPSAAAGRVIEPGAVDLAHGAILYLDDISVSFDGFKALNKLNLMIETGELRCIIGPNGAGKTTMMDVITGKTRADTGTAFFGQNIDLSRLSEAEIAHIGIGRKFQKPTVFEAHSVFENLELAMKVDKRVRHSLFARLDSAQRDKIAETLKLIQLQDSADRLAGLRNMLVHVIDLGGAGLVMYERMRQMEAVRERRTIAFADGRGRLGAQFDREVEPIHVPVARQRDLELARQLRQRDDDLLDPRRGEGRALGPGTGRGDRARHGGGLRNREGGHGHRRASLEPARARRRGDRAGARPGRRVRRGVPGPDLPAGWPCGGRLP